MHMVAHKDEDIGDRVTESYTHAETVAQDDHQMSSHITKLQNLGKPHKLLHSDYGL